jgi:hypothetical protein
VRRSRSGEPSAGTSAQANAGLGSVDGGIAPCRPRQRVPQRREPLLQMAGDVSGVRDALEADMLGREAYRGGLAIEWVSHDPLAGAVT